MTPENGASERIASLTGQPVAAIEKLGGGYTHSEVLRATLADSTTVVAKLATDVRTAADIRFEADVLAGFRLECMPRLIAYDDESLPLLLVEDLSDATWPPPWGDTSLLFQALSAVSEVTAPSWVPPLRDDRLPSWQLVMANPRPLLDTGLVSRAWLDAAVPILADSAASFSIEGTALLHADIWSGNVCFDGDRVVLIDWAGASAGNPAFDIGIAFLDILSSTGRSPDHAWQEKPSTAALLAAMKCHAVTLGTPDWAAPDWHQKQLDGLTHALEWASTEHGLPSPSDDIRIERNRT